MDMRITPQVAALVCSLAAVSCTSQVSDDDGSAPTVAVRAGAQLVRSRNCDEAQQQLRSHELARMNVQLDRAVAEAREALANGCPGPQPLAAGTATSSRAATGGKGGSGGAGGSGGSTGTAPLITPTTSGAATPGAMTQAAPATTTSGSASNATNPNSTAEQTSTTNNQVAEVDEADFVKNDNKYVYAAMNGAFRILTAWPPEEADEIARVALPGGGTPKKLLIHEDRALIYVSIPNTNARINNPRVAAFAPRSECSYGYDCEFGGDGTSTVLMVFDISDRENPRIVRRLDMAGSLIAARRIGSVVHTVAVTPEIIFQGVNSTLGLNICDPWLTEEQIDLAAASQRARNTRIINEIELPQISPSVREGDRDYGAEVCDSMYFDDEIAAGTAYTSLVAIDLAKQTDPGIATVVSKAGAVYASEQALYLAVPERSSGTFTLVPGATGPRPESSIVHKFRVSNDVEDIAYLASGTVKGSVLNQFSMDEHEGHLRIATTLGKVPDPNVYSALSVLAQEGSELEVVGQVDKIAPGEDIRSVRFDGDKGFVVTFKKTDPLYMFDLSKPEEPRITGELKIPGFSTYMHMLDDTHLLSIGYDAEDHDSFAFFSGLLLQIFDVSDPTAPKLQHKTVIGTRGSSSEALTNHLAFTFFNDMLALPMTICEGGTAGSFGDTTTFSGLILFDVSLGEGFVERGRVAHPSASGGYENASCTSWWTRASSVVQRSIFMDDYIYSIAADIMRVQNLNALGTDVSSVPLIN